MATTALIAYLVYLALAFGLRTAIQVRHTGSSVQVRVVEEPYLRQVHGHAYADYARSTGRFLPGVGRLKTID